MLHLNAKNLASCGGILQIAGHIHLQMNLFRRFTRNFRSHRRLSVAELFHINRVFRGPQTQLRHMYHHKRSLQQVIANAAGRKAGKRLNRNETFFSVKSSFATFPDNGIFP